MSKNKVNIICTTYNHEKYIRNCLDGFVGQIVNFPFNIIIHDDASSDDTQKIIREYCDLYPDLFVPILQKENQHSKGISIRKKYIDPMLDGEYVAFCQGDDFWCDVNKLQRQVDFLDSHPEFSACVHNNQIIDMKSGKTKIAYSTEKDEQIQVEDIIRVGGACFHTSSIVCRREYSMIPDNLSIRGIGDYPKAIYLGLCGQIWYFKDIMSVYRFRVEGSWSARQTRATQINNFHGIIKMLKAANEISNYTYDDAFKAAIRYHEYLVALFESNYALLTNNYKDIFKKEQISTKIKTFLIYRMPWLVKLINR